MKTPAAVPEHGAECPKPRVRDRIFETACALFYEHGINNVGVDAITSAAGTNKMSFYRSFASKDELVAEYLRERERALWQWWDGVVAPHADDPRRQIEVLFDGVISRCRGQNVWGCAAANAAAEIRDERHPALAVIHGQKAELRRRFRALAVALGAREPEVLGDALTLLFDGAATAKLTFACKDGPYVNVAKAVKALLDAQLAH
ncbi:MAG: TetR/AcrR family transcriptional regulator [Pseudomonadota bacterium]